MEVHLIDILASPRSYGVTTFLLGTLFILSIYHFFLYIQSREKIYLRYSLYTGLIVLAQMMVTEKDFFFYLTYHLRFFLERIHFQKIAIEWVYNLLYFLFIWHFVDINVQFKKQYLNIKRIVLVLFILAVVTQMADIFFPNKDFSYVVYIYTILGIPIIVAMSIYSLLFIYKAKSAIKFYAFIGSLGLLIFSLIAFVIMFDEKIYNYSPIIFYTGVFIENIFFSLGLGRKQKLIINNKNKIYKELEAQLALNKNLKEQLRLTLESEIALKSKTINELHKKSAAEQLKQIETRYEKELAELKISSLRSQMNPHFIFNSLNSIKHYIIDNDAKKAIYYLNKFSKLIRKILEGARQQEVPLADELETIKLYLTIENIRFNNEINIQYDIDESINIDTIKVPPLILQPFLENAIWHGLSAKEGVKKLTVSIQKTRKLIIITIEDNGIGRFAANEIKQRKVHKNKSIGIDLTIERMERFIIDYDTNYHLEIVDLYIDDQAAGTKVILNIPIVKTNTLD